MKTFAEELKERNEAITKLVQELTKTKRALDVAVDALKDNLSQANFIQMLDVSRFHCIRTKCELALNQIKQITETKGIK